MVMTRPLEEILPLIERPDAETLRQFDHPPQSLKRWVGILAAKAWMDADLACFFAEAESGTERYVLIFKSSNAYMAAPGGADMRQASVASIHELDVFVTAHHPPIIDRTDRARRFT